LVFDVVCQLPIANAKKKMVILKGLAFLTWQLTSGPTKSLPAFFIPHRCFFPVRVGSCPLAEDRAFVDLIPSWNLPLPGRHPSSSRRFVAIAAHDAAGDSIKQAQSSRPTELLSVVDGDTERDVPGDSRLASSGHDLQAYRVF